MFVDSACNIKWESTIEHFKYTLIENRIFNQSTTSKISFNVIHEDYGKQIRCSTECQYFKNTLANATTVIFEKKPTVVVSSIPVLPVPPNTNIMLTCVVNAHPVGNITWTMVKTSNSISPQTKTCLNASTCSYEMTTSDVEEVYSCYAKNEHGSDERSIVVVHEHNNKEDLTGKASGILGVTIGVLGGIAFLFIVIVVMFLCLRRNQARQQSRKEDTQLDQFQPPPNPDRDDTDVAEYADINKTRRDRENVSLPSKDKHSCDATKECSGGVAIECSVHVEQPSNDYGIISTGTGSSKQPDARGCQSKEDINTTGKEEDNGVSKQKHIINADTGMARIPKLHQ
ncbi:uncharacterized protein LOC128234325 [Mya arenaria]|uniref:uncharacterized protein LOC128234325 n=1 Tax=Mya arenaria TaxID=6604 RepID=UPI0022E8248C|nr:uncharacterized protein LOC128234325 [Mya arenaria]